MSCAYIQSLCYSVIANCKEFPKKVCEFFTVFIIIACTCFSNSIKRYILRTFFFSYFPKHFCHCATDILETFLIDVALAQVEGLLCRFSESGPYNK